MKQLIEIINRMWKREDERCEQGYQALVNLADKPKPLNLEPGAVQSSIKISKWKQHPTLPWERIPVVDEE